jgi:hypothetical protein
MSDKKATVKKAADKVAPKMEYSFVFGKQNYVLMAAGALVIALGFFLMSGTDDIFSTTKLTVAPIVVVLGFAIELVAIMYKTKE